MYTKIKHAVPKKISTHDSSEKKVQSATPGQQTCNPHQEHLHHQQLLDCGNWLHHSTDTWSPSSGMLLT